ncbi:MAG: cell cycle histidine kinase CckA [Candidatus Brocadiaceae bacterium]|nr:cell cycle histidine kinase CckA [Candidatus Brocadiaceae bacterium]
MPSSAILRNCVRRIKHKRIQHAWERWKLIYSKSNKRIFFPLHLTLSLKKRCQVTGLQVLMNLATNAMDAMPNGGLLTISTDVVELDDAFIKTHGYGEKGMYALSTINK